MDRFHAARDRDINVVHIVVGVKGTVRMKMDLTLRFDYGSIVPWVSHHAASSRRWPVPTRCILKPNWNRTWVSTVADFTVTGDRRFPSL